MFSVVYFEKTNADIDKLTKMLTDDPKGENQLNLLKSKHAANEYRSGWLQICKY